jgi:hypothetical protein
MQRLPPLSGICQQGTSALSVQVPNVCDITFHLDNVPSLQHLLLSLEVPDCQRLAFDGSRVWATPLAARALGSGVLLADPLRAGSSSAAASLMLAAYAGWRVAVPLPAEGGGMMDAACCLVGKALLGLQRPPLGGGLLRLLAAHLYAHSDMDGLAWSTVEGGPPPAPQLLGLDELPPETHEPLRRTLVAPAERVTSIAARMAPLPRAARCLAAAERWARVHQQPMSAAPADEVLGAAGGALHGGEFVGPAVTLHFEDGKPRGDSVKQAAEEVLRRSSQQAQVPDWLLDAGLVLDQRAFYNL